MTEQDEMKQKGSRKRFPEGRRNWTIRLDPDIGARIEATAKETGRSISEICERRIVKSFELEEESALQRRMIDGLADEFRREESTTQELLENVQEFRTVILALEARVAAATIQTLQATFPEIQHNRAGADVRQLREVTSSGAMDSKEREHHLQKTIDGLLKQNEDLIQLLSKMQLERSSS